MAPEFPETRDSLLLQIRDPANRESWSEFAAIYRPIVYRMARRRGLQDADAQDLAQSVLIAIAGAIADWQPDLQRARFRTWLSTVARNAIVDAFRRVRPDAGRGGTTHLQRLADEPVSSDQELAHERRREVWRWAARQVRHEFEEETWLAFWRTAVERIPVRQVAEDQRKTIGAVYTAKSRVMKRLQEKVLEFEVESEHVR